MAAYITVVPAFVSGEVPAKSQAIRFMILIFLNYLIAISRIFSFLTQANLVCVFLACAK